MMCCHRPSWSDASNDWCGCDADDWCCDPDNFCEECAWYYDDDREEV